MKKKYIHPYIKLVNVETHTFLCQSYRVSSAKDIGYGGMDEDDEHEAD